MTPQQQSMAAVHGTPKEFEARTRATVADAREANSIVYKYDNEWDKAGTGSMPVTLDVSYFNESTSSPRWMVLDPHQMMRPDWSQLASMITGPFFSREEAERVLEARRHHYSDRAAVYCASGCYTRQYDKAYRVAAQRRARDDNFKESVPPGYGC